MGVLVASVSAMGLKPLSKTRKATSQWGPLVYGYGLNNPNMINNFRMKQALRVAKAVPGVFVVSKHQWFTN